MNYYFEADNGITKCNGTPQPELAAQPLFNYHQYSEVIQAHFKNERRLRVQAICDGKIPPGVEAYTEHVLRHEFSSFFGPMDEKSPKFRLLFQNYEEERLEQIEMWCKEEESFYDQDSEQLLTSRFQEMSLISPPDKMLESALSKSAFPLEPFLVPRKKTLPKEFKRDADLTNLCHCDPEVFLNKTCVPPNLRHKLGDDLTSQMITISRHHATGVEHNVLCSKLEKLVDIGKLRRPQTEFSTTLKQYAAELMFPQFCNELGRMMYFPKYMEGFILTPMKLFEKLWHRLKIVVNLKLGIVKISKAFKMCSEIFGWEKIDPTLWGFKNEAEFVGFLIQYFDRWFALVPESNLKKGGRKETFYLVSCATEKQRRFAMSFLEKKRVPFSQSYRFQENVANTKSVQNSKVQKPSEANKVFPSLAESASSSSGRARSNKYPSTQNNSKPKSWSNLF